MLFIINFQLLIDFRKQQPNKKSQSKPEKNELAKLTSSKMWGFIPWPEMVSFNPMA